MNAVAQDMENHRAHCDRADAVARAVLDAVPEAGRLTVLDYGCGSGDVSLSLAGRFGHVILADSDPSVVKAAADTTCDVRNASVRLLDLTKDVPGDLRADIVLSAMSWHHIRDLGALLDAFSTVVPGGRLFVADLDADGGAYHADQPDFDGHNGFDRTRLVQFVAAHGCTTVTVSDLWHGHHWANGRRSPASVFLLQATLPSDRFLL